MERSYPVTVCGKHAGKVQVRRQGLYYLFSCRCSLTGDIMYRLVVTCGNTQENLGILVPENGCFVLQTKQPVKRFGEGDMSFSLTSGHEDTAGTFVRICPEEPFAYIARLKKSFLMISNAQVGISINKLQEP